MTFSYYQVITSPRACCFKPPLPKSPASPSFPHHSLLPFLVSALLVYTFYAFLFLGPMEIAPHCEEAQMPFLYFPQFETFIQKLLFMFYHRGFIYSFPTSSNSPNRIFSDTVSWASVHFIYLFLILILLSHIT